MDTKELRDSIRVLEEARQSLIEQRDTAEAKTKQIHEKVRAVTDEIDEEISREINPRIEGVDTAIQAVRRRLRDFENADCDQASPRVMEAKKERNEKHRDG